VTVKPSYGLSDAEIARMLQDSFSHASEDMEARALAEAQVEADLLIAATRNALEQDSDLLSPEEHANVTRALDALAATRAGSDRRAIVAATEALNHGTSEFAARRMNRGVQRALTGRRVDALT